MTADSVSILSEDEDGVLSKPALKAYRSWTKRALDITGAGLGLLFLSAFLIVIAVLIRLESRGPALFCQRRTGYRGKEFKIYKFRSMRVAEDGDVIKQASRGDERITKLGAFLRQSSIDELPQLINVLKGDMSLVGPRPLAIAHDRYYGAAIADYDARFLVRPGITGLAQVMGHRGATPDIESMAKRIDKDLEYIRRWSIKLDMLILWRTVMLGPFDSAAY
ncbi:MAG: undecaprenyl-phosphate glucose phosphotransferase [Caulobacteraceae bacterium]|nr:undecaprenyl-phosphate glucose phosphotransferase [Caulobacteraceae bacterium]